MEAGRGMEAERSRLREGRQEGMELQGGKGKKVR